MSPDVFAGLLTALQPEALLANLMGVALGIIFGALPGLTPTMGVALLIPITFTMPAVEAFAALLGMYVGSVYGGCITAILVGTPGTVAAAATTLEGPLLTAKGQSGKALDMATMASFVGGILSCVALVTLAPALGKVAMLFGAPEYFSLAIFALTIVAALSAKSMLKGLIAMLLGLLLSTIGLDPVSGNLRNTFDIPDLFSGISLVPALVGLFAVAQVLVSVEGIFKGTSVAAANKVSTRLSLREFMQYRWNLLRSSAIGTFIGLLPATGVSTASFIAYGEARRFSKTPEKFGTGTLEGIAATESANNAVTGGALIPLLTLGIPGDVISAILLGALMIQGLVPGPLLFANHTSVVYGIFASLFIANILMLVCGLFSVRIMGKILLVPMGILMPVVLTLCITGGYAINNSTFDLGVVCVFGILGYGMIKLGFPQPPLLLAMILAPLAETNFRRALAMSNNDYTVFVRSPISGVVLLCSALVLASLMYKAVSKGRD